MGIGLNLILLIMVAYTSQKGLPHPSQLHELNKTPLTLSRTINVVERNNLKYAYSNGYPFSLGNRK